MNRGPRGCHWCSACPRQTRKRSSCVPTAPRHRTCRTSFTATKKACRSDATSRCSRSRRAVSISHPAMSPSTFLFAFAGPSIVGRVSIRHALNPYLERVGGHIGYVVVPEFRRRGVATEMLRQALVIARDELGLGRVLVTCDDDNVGSIRTIEKNGGVLESVVADPEMATPKRRYWIDTAASALPHVGRARPPPRSALRRPRRAGPTTRSRSALPQLVSAGPDRRQ